MDTTLAALNANPAALDVVMGAMYYPSAGADLLGCLADRASARCKEAAGLEWVWVGPKNAGYDASVPVIRVFDANCAMVATIR